MAESSEKWALKRNENYAGKWAILGGKKKTEKRKVGSEF